MNLPSINERLSLWAKLLALLATVLAIIDRVHHLVVSFR